MAKSKKSDKAPKSSKPAKFGKSDPYQKKAKRLAFLSLPPAKLVTLKRDELTFDRALQHRTKLVDEETAKDYAEVLKDALEAGKPNPFPPLRVVREKIEEFGAVVLKHWVYDGFQRGAAYELAGVDSCPCEVVEGTYEDAFFLSLSSNSDHGKQRTGDDKRRTILALIDDEAAFKRVQSKAKAGGGLHRAISAATGVSTGWIVNALSERGLAVRGNELVKAKPKKAKATPAKSGGQEGPADEAKPDALLTGEAPPAAVDPAAQKAANDRAYADMCAVNFTDRVKAAEKALRKLGAIVATIVTDPVYGQTAGEVLARHGLSVAEEFTVKAKESPDDFEPYYEVLEHWPIASKLGSFFADLLHDIDKSADVSENEQGEPKEARAPGVNGKGRKSKAKA